MFNLKTRLRAAGIHFGISAVVAVLAALLVFVVWYPYPYSEISGGRELFLIVVSVDIVLGPLLTFAVFDRKKSLGKLRFDLAVIALLQLTGLAYGLWTVFVARPVHLVFEYDRFRVVHALEVPQDLMGVQAPPEFRSLPVSGPTLLSLRPFANPNEKADKTIIALAGVQLSAQPSLWQSYAAAKAQVLAEAKPLTKLLATLPLEAPKLLAAAKKAGRDPQTLVYLPMVGRKTFWTVLVDPASADILGFAPVDSF